MLADVVRIWGPMKGKGISMLLKICAMPFLGRKRCWSDEFSGLG